MAENNNNKPQVRVASIEVELGMSVQNKAGIWCKPTARMVLTVDGGTSPAQRAAIIKQGFDNYEALLGYGDIEENVAPVESEEKPKAEKTTKKRSYSEVFEAEENIYIKEALSKWLKVCKDRGVKFNIRTVKKWAETLRKEAKENPTVALKIVDQSVENAWNNLYPLKAKADSKVVSTVYDPAELARDESGNLKVF